VKAVAGEDAAVVPFVVDWNEFRFALSRSLRPMALGRYLHWNGHRQVSDDELHDGFAAKQGTIV
jgi:hypothetical protein